MLRHVLLAAIMTVVVTATDGFYGLRAKTLEGKTFSFDSLRGKVVLIVNVASECGYTKSNYNDLNKLHRAYNKKGLEILAFPCDQFGHQEPGSPTRIRNFCDKRGVEFQVMRKVAVNGKHAHPVFRFVKAFIPGKFGWNFEKVIVDRAGHVVDRYDSDTRPWSLRKQIEHLLAASTPKDQPEIVSIEQDKMRDL